MNINEVERAKPREAYAYLKKLLKKYSEECATEVMDDEDAIRKKMALEIKNDLLRFKKIFLSGD